MFTLVVHFFHLCVFVLPCMPVKCQFETVILLRFCQIYIIFTAAIVQQIIKYIKFCICSNTNRNLNLLPFCENDSKS